VDWRFVLRLCAGAAIFVITEELVMRAHRRLRLSYMVSVGVVLCVGTVAAAAGLAVPASPVVALTADSGPCGTTGVLTNPTTCSYTTIGSDTFTVPSGVSSVTLDVVGAQGGHYFIAGDAGHGGSPAGDITGRLGGNGGEAAGMLTGLSPGQVLQVDVAGKGVNGTAASRSGGMMDGPSGGQGALGGFGGSNGGVAGGPGDASGANGGTAFNGGNGSGAGGSSDVRSAVGGCAALTCALSTRVLVGAGGGGGGGVGGQGNALGGAGGDGGGTTGANGGTIVDGGNAGVSGTGGTQTAGGVGGLNPGRHASGANPSDPRYGGDGANGSSGPGGVGGAGNLPCTGTQNPPCSGGQNPTTSGGGAGGGAGGGYFGGGGGSGGGGLFGGGGGAGGGGAGGSAFAAATVTSATLTSGVNNGTINGGNGQVTIIWSAPTPTPTPGTLNGGGAQTTQGVMTALSSVITISGTRMITSWDAATAPGQTITTKPTPACTNIARPSNSDGGILALVNDRNAGTHCWQFARSSIDNHTSRVGDHLTYIPFATDAITYAIRGPGATPAGSSINRNLSVATLKTIYTQTGTSCLAAFEPLLPQFGSGTRKFFLENVLGLGSGADVANYAGPTGLHPCVKDTDTAGNPLLANAGNLLISDKQIVPYAVSAWIAQTTKNVSDVHGVTLLGNIAGIPSTTVHIHATGTRPVFNVVPNVLVQGPSNSKTVFVGPTSLVCQNTATILKQGLVPNPNCGDTTTQSDPNFGTDTVGPGE
jgi:hypothetical protein